VGPQEDGALRVTHDLTQREIAQLVGASRETVNKALNNDTAARQLCLKLVSQILDSRLIFSCLRAGCALSRPG
jgi:hypothetical protein